MEGFSGITDLLSATVSIRISEFLIEWHSAYQSLQTTQTYSDVQILLKNVTQIIAAGYDHSQ